jgi:hypothetical protein
MMVVGEEVYLAAVTTGAQSQHRFGGGGPVSNNG